jgi:hypothetical protein
MPIGKGATAIETVLAPAVEEYIVWVYGLPYRDDDSGVIEGALAKLAVNSNSPSLYCSGALESDEA